MSDELPPHPAIGQPGRCGARVWVGGLEWVCIRHEHFDTTTKYVGYVPQADRHYYVRRFPGTDH